MADILLTVGVDTKASYTDFKNDIALLVSQIGPVNIEVQIDKNSLSVVVGQLTNLAKAINTTSSGKTFSNIASGADQLAISVSQAGAGLGELTKRTVAFKDGANTASAVTSTYKDTLARTTTTIRQVADETDGFKTSLETVTTTYETQKEASAQSASTLRSYNNAIIQGEAALRKWSAAEHSTNLSSKNAYTALRESVDAVRSAKTAYDNGSENLSSLQSRLSEYQTTLKTTEQTLKANGNATASWTEKIKNLGTKLSTLLTGAQAIRYAVQALKQLATAAIEVDSALTQLKIVTGATDAEMTSFLSEAVSLSQELGQSVTDIISSIETFSRLGYNLGDASELAEYAAVLSNVAAVDTDEATTGLTSIIKGYDLDVSQAEHVADVLVEVGQKYAVSASEMITAYEKSGAALSATGTSFEKSAGLIASANAAVQNAGTVGTALKTVSARIRGATSELEELGEDTSDLADGLSKYADELESLTGFSILEPGTTNEYKDIYDIFGGIAEVWDTLSDTVQSRVSEILGGTRQLQVISSILGNWDDAVNAYADAMDSAGAATEANETYMESITAHIEQFKAAGQSLGTDVFNSAGINLFIDAGTSLVKVLDKLVSTFGTFGTVAIPAFIAGFKSSIQSLNAFRTQVSVVNSLLEEGQTFTTFLGDNGNWNTAHVLAYAQTISGLREAEQSLIMTQTGLTTTQKDYVSQMLTAINSSATLTAEKISATVATSSEEQAYIKATIAKALDTETTTELTFAQIANAAATGKLDSALFEQIMTTYLATTATKDYTKANLSLGASLKAVWASNPVGVVVMLVSSIVSLVSWMSTSLGLFDSAADKAEELRAEYDELASELESVESELEETAERIAELQDLVANGTITLVEQEELDKLEQENEYLEAQVRLLEEAAQYKAAESNEALEEAFEEKRFSYSPWAGATVEGNKTIQDVALDGVTAAITLPASTYGAIASTSAYIDQFKETVDEYYAASDSLLKTQSLSAPEYISTLIDEYTALANSENLTIGGYERLEVLREKLVEAADWLYSDVIEGYVGDSDTLEYWKSLADGIDICINKAEHYSEALENLPDSLKETLNEEGSEQSLTAKRIEKLAEQYEALASFMEETGFTAQELANHYNTLTESVSTYEKNLTSLTDLVDSINSINDVIDTANEEMATGGVSTDTIAALAEITSNYIDYLYVENGVIKMNTAALQEMAEAKKQEQITEIESEIASLKQRNAELEQSIAYYQEYQKRKESAAAVAGDSLGNLISASAEKDYTDLIEDNTEELQANSEALEQDLELLDKYYAMLDSLTSEITANTKALSGAKSGYHSLISQLKSVVQGTESFDDATSATAKNILSQIKATKSQIAQYSLLQTTLLGAADAFEEFQNAQDIDTESDYSDDFADMVESLIGMYENNEFGTEAFKSAFSSLIPDDVYSQFKDYGDRLDAGWAYLQDKVARYFTYDDGDVTVNAANVEQFVQDALDNGTFTGTLKNFEIAPEIQSLEDLAEAMGITTAAAFALGNAISDYTIDNDDFLSELLANSDSLESRIYACDDAMASLLERKAEMLSSGEIDTQEWTELDEAIREAEEDYSALSAEAREEIQLAIDNDGKLERLQANADSLYEQLQALDESDVDYEATFANYLEAQEQLANFLAQMEEPSELTITVAMESIQSEIDDVKAQLDTISNYDEEANVYVAVDGASQEDVDSLVSKLKELEAEYSSVELYAGTNYEDVLSTLETVENFEIEDKTFSLSMDGYETTRSKLLAIIGLISQIKSESITIDTTSSGGGNRYTTSSAQVNGSANASGNWGLKQPEHRALVGELGPEIVVDPSTGRYYTVGNNGAEFVDIPKGAIIFNHLQTRQLLENGKAMGRGSAFAEGNAHLGLLDGGYSWGSYGQSGSSSSSSGSTSSSSSDDSNDDDSEIIDWIEIAISRIERVINNLSTIAESAFHKLSEKLTATNDEISEMTYDLSLQQSAYERYLQEANSVGLSSDLAAKVQNGTIDINEYDSDTADLISQYQEWLEKALECSDAILELSESLAELYQNKFDDVATDYENQLSLLEHLTNTYNNSIDDLEERGYLVSTKYYTALQEVEAQNIAVQKKELSDLTAAMSEAINSGYIEEGSEAWYEMQQEINSVKEAIQESEMALVEYANAIRDLKWERFDYLQEQISYITEEADFLIDLMESSDLYTDNGQLTDTGMATMGLHAQNYNVYMAQADKYAEELLALNEEIANDPNNTTLLERREELLEAQRDSILSAEDEKQAIIDMVEEGIDLELESLQDLIDAYEDSLDAAKDLYDYQKKVKDQTAEIASIQKQLAAYSGDNSEETRATIQKLQVDLSDAMEDLEETQYDNYISEQKKLLDNLYDEYEAILNQRLDDVDALLADMIDMINVNSASISDTIAAESEAVGYTLSESISEIWANGGGAYSIVTKYGDSFLTQLTSVNAVLDTIAASISDAVTASDELAETTISTSSTSTAATTSGQSSESTSSSSSSSSSSGASSGYNSDVKQGVAAAIWINGSEQSGWGSGSTRQKRLAEKFGSENAAEIQNYINAHGSNGDLYKYWVKAGKGSLSQYYYKAFKAGGLADYTGMAWLDGTPTDPEMVLSSEDTANFIALKDAMQDIAKGESFLSNLFDTEDIASQIVDNLSQISSPSTPATSTMGDIIYQVNIPIEHVQDYRDFMNQMSKDGKFEKLIRSMTVDRLVGGSEIAKNKYTW